MRDVIKGKTIKANAAYQNSGKFTAESIKKIRKAKTAFPIGICNKILAAFDTY
jgi:hypothetical protein